MKKTDIQKLKHGLYKIFWKSGGSSLAAIGSTRNGDRWIAPTNWVGIGTSDHKYWKDIEKIEAL